jgi:Zn-dependent protease
MSDRLYTTDSRNLTWRECWYQTRSANVLILGFLKLFRIRLTLPVMSYPDSVHQHSLQRETFPPEALASLDPLVAELTDAGFHSTRYYRYAASRSQIEILLAAMLSPDGRSIARVMHVVSRQSHPPTRTTRVFILSVFQNERWFVTSPLRQEFEANPAVEVLRLPGASATQLAQAHTAALDRRTDLAALIPIPDHPTAERLADEYERSCFEHGIRRGLYIPLTDHQQTEEQTAAEQSELTRSEVGSDLSEVLLAMERLQNPKPSLKSALWILAGSLVAFVVLGGSQWDWEFVLLLLPVLFVHEAGHWVAMKVFGYRNLRMFFIPLFGAAVSGQNFNVAGWKKALVSLAGPAPGIVAATALSAVAMAFDQPWMERIALLTIVLNAINLLPFLPLDGGWYLNAVLFCRRAWLETGFKAVATAAFVFATFATGDRFWLFLGVLMGISLPSTWRVGRLAESLQRSGFDAVSEEGRTIRPETALALVRAVTASTPRTRPVQVVATEALNLFERLNARPPGILATLALLAAYGATLLIALVGFVAASYAQWGD